MTHKVGPKGQVVIPKDDRERLGIGPGSEVVFESVDGAVLVRRKTSVRSMGGMFKGESNMAAQLLEDRARERK